MESPSMQQREAGQNASKNRFLRKLSACKRQIFDFFKSSTTRKRMISSNSTSHIQEHGEGQDRPQFERLGNGLSSETYRPLINEKSTFQQNDRSTFLNSASEGIQPAAESITSHNSRDPAIEIDGRRRSAHTSPQEHISVQQEDVYNNVHSDRSSDPTIGTLYTAAASGANSDEQEGELYEEPESIESIDQLNPRASYSTMSSELPNSYTVFRGRKGARYRVNIRLPGKDTEAERPWLWALADTGSFPNCIFKAKLEEFLVGHIYYYRRPLLITGIAGQQVQSIGQVVLFFSFKDRRAVYDDKFEVLEDQSDRWHPNWDLLIGVKKLLSSELVTFSSAMGDSYYIELERRHSGTVVFFD